MEKQTIPDIPATDSAGVNIMPPFFFYCCLLSGICLDLIFPWTLRAVHYLIMLSAGAGIIAAGIFFMMWGHGRFRSLGVNVPTNLPVSRLVTDGAYQYSRNPMYVGFMSILVGLGVAIGSLWMLASALLMFLYLSIYVIPREEAYLGRRFGAEYKTYRNIVRRWL
ncbi:MULTISPECIES: isoprenylcysteine carboxylmethyltransferase family protein [unclassified Pseudodesulfovibrio]|uniref:methyltransferase family protein n=1 Tax=unclassified Pseudodesulfovibrio TaxID=2661612 RepID=UPI0013E3B0AD|nr:MULTISPECIES: isoprenylcysteine carboxylmethyltransferase family protein [unclassified Pseudodesulfovibrio]MCJ2164309.1 isoprenylcysteine carboxylmethyltransferase family protein [Pseudodesulfovibrio sp. S3-i]